MALDTASERSAHHLGVLAEIAPELEALGDQIEATGVVSDRVLDLLIGHDMLRLTLPERWGGHGLSFGEYAPVLEKAAGLHGAIRMYVHGMNGLWRPLHDFGTEAQRERWLPVHRGGGLFSFALTEPGNGTGRDISTSARREGEDWVLNGTKHLITWAGWAEVMYLIAVSGRTAEGPEITCFLVPKGARGMSCTPHPECMGCRGSRHDIVVFEECRIPGDAVLGEVGQGLAVGLRGFLDVSRLGIATSCLGVAQRSFELACGRAEGRVTFGRPLSARQAVQTIVAEMATDLFATRAAIQATAHRFDRGLPIAVEAAMCKLLGMEMVGRVTDQALRLFGGIGYTTAHRIERLYRDARALWFEEGTAEVQKAVISRAHLRGRGPD
jgi:alkylation response protein AidB-like acyl-CoA dehydrogenase